MLHILKECRIQLTGKSIHVWPILLRTSDVVLELFGSFLAPDERERVSRFRFDHLRHSFVLTRGTLRVLVGGYLNLHPADVCFKYGPNGKPALAMNDAIDFNLSHSGEMALFAFTTNCELGIDVEQIRSIPDMQNIADHFFCPEEAAELMLLPTHERELGFFRCWTRKEAYVKATGYGLAKSLNAFRVTLEPDEPARLLHFPDDPSAASDWTLLDIRTSSCFASALAYRDAPRPLSILPIITTSDLLEMYDMVNNSLDVVTYIK